MKKLIALLLISTFAFCEPNVGNRRDTFPKPITVTEINSVDSIPIDSYYSPLKTYTVVSGAVTVDWDESNCGYIELANGANTITLTNPKSLGRYILILKQPASGAAGTVTFSPIPYASSGALPTLTTTNSSVDVIPLIYIGGLNKYVLGSILDVK